MAYSEILTHNSNTGFYTTGTMFASYRARQRNLTIFKMCHVATPEDEMVGTMPSASLTDAVAVDMEKLRVQHCVFIPETYF
jgi:hypothetical protein